MSGAGAGGASTALCGGSIGEAARELLRMNPRRLGAAEDGDVALAAPGEDRRPLDRLDRMSSISAASRTGRREVMTPESIEVVQMCNEPRSIDIGLAST